EKAFLLEEALVVGHQLGQALERRGRFEHELFHDHPPTRAYSRAGSQAAVRISPNARGALLHDSPASSVRNTSPKRLYASRRLPSAGCAASPQIVEFGRLGSGSVSHVSPKSCVRNTWPVSPVVVSPQPTNTVDASSVFTASPRA